MENNSDFFLEIGQSVLKYPRRFSRVQDTYTVLLFSTSPTGLVGDDLNKNYLLFMEKTMCEHGTTYDNVIVANQKAFGKCEDFSFAIILIILIIFTRC